MFDYFKKAAISNRADDELLYEMIAKELSNNIRKEGLWLKAIQHTDGDEKKSFSPIP